MRSARRWQFAVECVCFTLIKTLNGHTLLAHISNSCCTHLICLILLILDVCHIIG